MYLCYTFSQHNSKQWESTRYGPKSSQRIIPVIDCWGVLYVWRPYISWLHTGDKPSGDKPYETSKNFHLLTLRDNEQWLSAMSQISKDDSLTMTVKLYIVFRCKHYISSKYWLKQFYKNIIFTFQVWNFQGKYCRPFAWRSGLTTVRANEEEKMQAVL